MTVAMGDDCSATRSDALEGRERKGFSVRDKESCGCFLSSIRSRNVSVRGWGRMKGGKGGGRKREKGVENMPRERERERERESFP